MPARAPDCTAAKRALRRKTHATTRRVRTASEARMQRNTSGASLMGLVNEIYAFSDSTERGAPARNEPPVGAIERKQTVAVLCEAVNALVLMIAPFAPHMAEELWEKLGHPGGLSAARWPVFDAEVAKADELVVPVQINGKVRTRMMVAADASEEQLRESALTDAVVKSHMAGKTIRKVVVAKGPLVSIVVS